MSDTYATLCQQCGRPIKETGVGSSSQRIAACRCKETIELKASAGSIETCQICKKRLANPQDGSLTDSVIGSDACNCGDRTIPSSAKSDSASNDSTQPSFAEPELELDSDSFPSDRYKPIAEIGRGAAGFVYLCQDRLLQKTVAVKVLRTVTAEQLVNFQREAKATSQLKHPCVVAVLDFGGTSSGAPYMVMEYVKGITLEQYHKTYGPLPWEHAAKIFVGVTDALATAHQRAVFHRDLKSSNILIVGDNHIAMEVRIIDFGIASVKHVIQEPTIVQGNTIVGTPAYMPPDQVNGLPYDARSEIYSLGCVFFESLTGRVPFEGDTALETIAKHVNDPVPELSDYLADDFPDGLQIIIGKCLSKEPKLRFQSMSELREALNVLCSVPEDGPIDTRVDPRTGSAFSAVAVLLILAFVVLGAFYALESGSFLKPEKKKILTVINSTESYRLEELARNQMAEGNYAQALQTANQAISCDKYNERAIEARGLANFLNGSPGRARADFTKVISSSGDNQTIGAAKYHLEILNRATGKKSGDLPHRGDYIPMSWELKKFAPFLKEEKIISDQVNPLSAMNVSQIGKSAIFIKSGNDETLVGLKPTPQRNTLILRNGFYTKSGFQKLKGWPIQTLVMDKVTCTEDSLLALFPLTRLKNIEIERNNLSNKVLLKLTDSPIESLSLIDCSLDPKPFFALKNSNQLNSISLIRCEPIDGNDWKDLVTLPIRSVTWVPPETSSSSTRSYPPKSLQVICNLPHLNLLSLDANALDDTNTKAFKNLSRLDTLVLTRSRCLSESCMSEVCKIRSLRTLGLAGEIASPKVLLQLRTKRLHTLRLEHLEINPGLIFALSKLNVEKLELSLQSGDPKSLKFLARNKFVRRIVIAEDTAGMVTTEDLRQLSRAMPHCKIERLSYSAIY